MIRRLTIALLIFLAGAAALTAAAPAWEHVQSVPREVIEEVTPDTTTEIVVSGGYIYVYLSRPTEVKLFSILGQPISTVQLPAGTHRLRMTTRGIYLLRAGSTTRRVTV